MPVFISNMVYINKYDSKKQEFFGFLNNFSECKESEIKTFINLCIRYSLFI